MSILERLVSSINGSGHAFGSADDLARAGGGRD